MPPQWGQGSLSRGGRAQPKGGSTRAAGLRMTRSRGGAPRLLACSAARASAPIPTSATFQQPHPTRQAAGRPKTAPAEEKKWRPRGRAADCGHGPPKGDGAAGSRPTPRARPLSQGPNRAAALPIRQGHAPFLRGGGAPLKKDAGGGRNAGRGSPLCAGLRGGGPRRPRPSQKRGQRPTRPLYTPARLTKSAQARGRRATAP